MIGSRPTKIGSYSRIIYFVFYFLIMFQVAPQWLWDSDWFKILNTFMFGLTNGYFATLCAVLGPATVEEKYRQECGAFIGTIIVIGITIGSFCQIPLGYAIDVAPKNHD